MSLIAGAGVYCEFRGRIYLYVYEHIYMHKIYDSVDLNSNVLL